MFNHQIDLKSLAETKSFAKILSENLYGGALVGLRGPLGAGKTALVRECLRNLGVIEDICSPTFVLEATYNLPNTARFKKASHWDLYRITTGKLEADLLEGVGDKNIVTFVEWPERVSEINQRLTVDIFLDFLDNPSDNDQYQDEGRKMTVKVINDVNLEKALSTK